MTRLINRLIRLFRKSKAEKLIGMTYWFDFDNQLEWRISTYEETDK